MKVRGTNLSAQILDRFDSGLRASTDRPAQRRFDVGTQQAQVGASSNVRDQA
jgi:Mg-chelatase subunit ChlI